MLVASVQALFQHTLTPAELPEQPLELKTGQRMSQERVLRELVDLGYEALPEVAGRGEFARRGGIVDVFPAGQPLPVRIEWFGDEIESLRAFDPANQRGIRPVDDDPAPAGERVPARRRTPERSSRDALGTAANRLPDRPGRRPGPPRAGPARRRGRGLGGPARAVRRAWTTSATRSVLIDEPADVDAAADFLWTQADERRAELEKAGVLPKSWPAAYPGRATGSSGWPRRARWS